MKGNENAKRLGGVRREVSVAACDTEALVRVSAQFADLGLEFVRQPTPTATQVALDKADWTAVGTAMGRVYQALCDQDNEGVLTALHTIDTILTKHGVLVPQPILRHPPEGAQTHGE